METNSTENNISMVVEPTNDEKQYAMFIHFAQFAGLVIPILGWLLPFILWQSRKNTSAYIDRQGVMVMNWIISNLIYVIISCILCLVVVGILLLIALSICNLIFIIIGGLKANNGEICPYPLSIPFLK